MGLFIAVTSYDGKITFSATSCRRTMPDVELFIEFMRQSFDELSQLAINRASEPSGEKITPTKKPRGKKTSKKASKKIAKKTAKKATATASVKSRKPTKKTNTKRKAKGS